MKTISQKNGLSSSSENSPPMKPLSMQTTSSKTGEDSKLPISQELIQEMEDSKWTMSSLIPLPEEDKSLPTALEEAISEPMFPEDDDFLAVKPVVINRVEACLLTLFHTLYLTLTLF
mmetsp:Transcript_32003/g.41025  ORF Transcript_32003/g.41025 Transcript_32003/m.41025 type:complete len:117 (-) Transcript_32003:30-380(-)